MYIDDLVTGEVTFNEVKQIKNDSVLLFQKRSFKLHKWSCNISKLENNNSNHHEELSFAKQVLNQDRNEIKILGLVLQLQFVILPV